MKKQLALLLSVVLLIQSLGNISVMAAEKTDSAENTKIILKQPDGMAIETTNIINTDFKENVPSGLKDNIDVLDDESMLYINGNGNIVGSGSHGSFGANSYLEAEIKMPSSDAATSGAISITMHDKGSVGRTVRFAYMFAVRYNPETGMCSGGPVINDRLAIVDAGAYGLNKWRAVKISDKPIGARVNGKSQTVWMKFKIISYEDTYYFSAYDENGNLLESLSATREELFGESMSTITPTGAFRATMNSAQCAIRKLRGGNIEVVEGLKMMFETSSAKAGTPVAYYFEDLNGNRLDLGSAEPVVDGENIILADDGKIIFNQMGKQELTVKVSNLNTGTVDDYKAEINILDELKFKSIEVIPEKTSVYKNAPLSFTVKGVDSIGDKFIINPDEYKVLYPALDNDSPGTVDFEQTGTQKIKVEQKGVTGEADIYVSKFDKITPTISASKIEQKSSVSYSLTGKENGAERTLDFNEYVVTADKEGLVISPDGTIFAQEMGIFTLYFTADKVTEKITLNVIERQQGVLINENFDTPGDPQYFPYRPEKIVDDNGNKVFRIADEETEFYGGEAWKAYTISAKVKINKSVLDERCTYSTFEITPLKKYNTTAGTVGGEGGIQCIYRLNHNIESGPHMRISASVGPQINIEDGKYHDIKVVAYENQVIFSIDGVKQYYYQSRDITGYFTFTANNCEVYIDDLVVTRDPHSEKKERAGISAEEEIVEMNPYAPMEIRAINAFRLNYTDGTYNYKANLGTHNPKGENPAVIWYELVDGAEYCKIRNGYTIVFDKDVPAGTVVTVKANFENFSCYFKVKATPPDMTYEDYVKNTVDLRKESQTFRLLKGWGNGIDNSESSRGTLAHRLAVMSVYPKLKDYTDVFRWYAKATHFEEVYVGRGTDAGDFILQQGMFTYMKLKGIANVSDEAWEEWKQFILNYVWVYPDDGMTENHRGIYYASAVMAGETFPDDIMYDGKTGKETFDEHLKYLTDWYNYRYTHGHGEYDSGEYYNINIFDAELLYNSIKDERIKQAAKEYMAFIYADMLHEELGGSLTGAHLRSYHKSKMNYMNCLGIYFNLSDYMINESAKANVQEIPFPLSSYMPDEILYDIAFDEDRTTEVTERHYLYILTDDPLHNDSIVKYTYRTPEYSLGTRIYGDDFLNNSDYNIVSSKRIEIDKTFKTELLATHQGYMWGFTPGKGVDVEITENHPGTYDFYGDGYWICDCGKYYQHKGASIGMHKIVDIKKQEQHKYTHFYIPRNRLDLVEDEDGWVFVKHEDVYLAIKALKDGQISGTLHEWGDPNKTYNGMKMSDCELKITSANTAFVSEATSKSEFGGTYEEFKARVKENEKNIVYKAEDKNTFLEYTALDGTKLKIDFDKNKRYLNDVEADFTNAKLFDSPYVQSEWLSGVTTITAGDKTLTINPVKYNVDITTAWSNIRKINKIIDELEYEIEFGRGAQYIAANSKEIKECISFTASYNNTFLYDVVCGRIKVLTELITEYYNNAPDTIRVKIQDIVDFIQSKISA